VCPGAAHGLGTTSDMPIVITCPECRRKAKVPESALGKTVRCPGCGATFPATAEDAGPPPPHDATDEGAAPDLPGTPSPEDDARRAVETGVLLLAASQGLLAAGLALQLLLALFRLALSDAGPRSSAAATTIDVVTLLGVLAQVAAAVGFLIGGAFCALPSVTPARPAAGAVLVLAVVVTALSANPFGEMLRSVGMRDEGWGMGDRSGSSLTPHPSPLPMMFLPVALDAALQALLAVYARANALRLRDRTGAGMATVLVVAYPVVRVGLYLITVLVGIFSGSPHPTFTQVITVLELLARTALVAWGAVVLLRVASRATRFAGTP